jgi:protein-disulfide isomerase
MKRFLPIIIIAVVLIITLGGAWLLMSTPKPASSQPQPSLASAPPMTPPPVNVQPAHYKGRIDAPVQLEEFGDYQCPPCGNFHPIMQRILAQYGDRIRFSFRNFPITNKHPFALEAARAAEAAGQQGKFWEMHDLLYDKQTEWSNAPAPRPFFIKYAQQIGLDVNRFQQDIDGAVAGMRVAEDLSLVQMRGVPGTPTLYLNGREVPFEQIMDFDKLRAVIDAALAGKA